MRRMRYVGNVARLKNCIATVKDANDKVKAQFDVPGYRYGWHIFNKDSFEEIPMLVSEVVGQKYSRLSFGEIIYAGEFYVTVRNADGRKWDVGRNIFEAEFKLSHEVTREETVSRTTLTEIMNSYANTIMTVYFHKKNDHQDLVSAVLNLLEDDSEIRTKSGTQSKVKLSKLLKAATEGEGREMTGYHNGNYNVQGRLMFCEDGNNKLVDPRTIEWLIVDGIKFIVN